MFINGERIKETGLPKNTNVLIIYTPPDHPKCISFFLQTKTNKGSSLVNQSVIFRKIWYFFFLPTNYKCLPWSSLVWFTTTWHMQKEPAYCWQVCVKVLSTYCFLLFWAIENNLQWVPFTCIEKMKNRFSPKPSFLFSWIKKDI